MEARANSGGADGSVTLQPLFVLVAWSHLVGAWARHARLDRKALTLLSPDAIRRRVVLHGERLLAVPALHICKTRRELLSSCRA